MELHDENPDRPPLSTMTHARLRAGQGDVEGARRLLREILRQRPGHREAMELLDSLAGRRGRKAGRAVPDEEPEPVPVEAGDLAEGFRSALGGGEAQERIRRLRRLLERIEAMRGERRA